MAGIGRLTNTPLRQDLAFNWVFLVELVVCGILTLFFLFYFNRVFATFISYSLRAWTWHRYRVYIDIQALQVSLLGGRVFFKGFRYHGNNETIYIQSGFVTWCYWLRNVRQLDVAERSDLERENGSLPAGKESCRAHTTLPRRPTKPDDAQRIPCRFQVTLKGAEWFVYNRSAAYDAVLSGLEGENHEFHGSSTSTGVGQETEGHTRRRGNQNKSDAAAQATGPGDHDFAPCESNLDTSSESHAMKDDHRGTSSDRLSVKDGRLTPRDGSLEGSMLLRFLPIYVECEKAAVVLGNQHTRAVLITKADRISGEINATRSTILDQYRQLIDLRLEHPVIQIKPNDDFKESQDTSASRAKHDDYSSDRDRKSHAYKHSVLSNPWHKAWQKLQAIFYAFPTYGESLAPDVSKFTGNSIGTEPAVSSWQGLSRYIDESEQDDNTRWSSIEYAAVSTILDSTEASMSFYWDVVGTVRRHSIRGVDAKADIGNINGDVPPEWGINMFFKAAMINYGPWADRQRADVQRVFFPSLSKDAKPAAQLVPGQLRIPTQMKIYIEFEEETTLRIPIKEESKNWRWKPQRDAMWAQTNDLRYGGKSSRKAKPDKTSQGPEGRPFGWLDVKVGANAVIRYHMDLVAGPGGYSNKLELDLPNTEITTSVNHGLLWKSVDNQIACDLSSPLQWNGYHAWVFNLNIEGLELFILREHIFLLTDLVDDWTNGPPSELLSFSPFRYLINLELKNFKLYLNVNESNIINNPSDFDDNTFIVIFGSTLTAGIGIPMEKYRPHRNDISFDLEAKHAGLDLHVPPWNTQATFLHSTQLATVVELKASGRYQYCSTTSTSNTDTLLLDVHSQSASATFYGFMVRYLLRIKDNYFGDDIRFKTLEEYQNVLSSHTDGDTGIINSQPPHKKSNDLDVILSIFADECNVILPSNLYSSINHIRIDIARISSDLRFTNYYMDLDIALSPLAFSQSGSVNVSTPSDRPTLGTQLFVDGLNLSGNRLFGLPPTEPTYVCNWDFSMGAITGECTTDFLARLISSGKAFSFSFDDDENALPPRLVVALHDVTFLRASVASIQLWLLLKDSTFCLESSSILLSFSDWANSHFSEKLKVSVPQLNLSCVDFDSVSRQKTKLHHTVSTHAMLETTLFCSMTRRKLAWTEDRRSQEDHIRRHDQRTHRAAFLLSNGPLDESTFVAVDAPAMVPPSLPVPVYCDNIRLKDAPRNSKSYSDVVDCGSLSVLKTSLIDRGESNLVDPSPHLGDAYGSAHNPRSKSLKTSITANHRLPRSDSSVSAGRQSSFYSATGDRHLRPLSTTTIPSSYIRPHFTLEAVKPDTNNLPKSALSPDEHPTSTRFDVEPEDAEAEGRKVGAIHTSFLLEFPAGVSGFCSPRSAEAIIHLLAELVAVEPADLIDELQMDATRETYKMRGRRTTEATILDIGVRASFVNLRFMNVSDATRQTDYYMQAHDQYDVSMSRLSATWRSKITDAMTRSIDDIGTSYTVHLSVRKAHITAEEKRISSSNTQPAIDFSFRDVEFWAFIKEEIVANWSCKEFQILIASCEVESLIAMLDRTQNMASCLKETFDSQQQQGRHRTQLFAYLVTSAGTRATDPLFLTRPSYILRSATDHLRTSDSWKIVTRLHYMFCSLDLQKQQEISSQCLDNTQLLPQNAREVVIAGFNEWRSWDLNNTGSSLIVAKIYGQQMESNTPPRKQRPLRISAHAEEIHFVVDSGSKPSDISISDITFLVEVKLESSGEDIGPQAEVSVVQATLVQTFVAESSIHLNWELCELAEKVVRLYRNHHFQGKSMHDASSRTSQESQGKGAHELHVVFMTEKVSLVLSTINLDVIMATSGLKASFTKAEPGAAERDNIVTLLLAAEAATANVQSHSQHLSLLQLQLPSIHVSYRQSSEQEPYDVLSFAGNCRRSSIDGKQDILAFLELFDLFIGDEIASLCRLMRSGADRTPVSTQSMSSQVPSRNIRFNVALFLDLYEVSLPLMQSLRYSMAGDGARASISARMGSDVLFDFDVKENSHDIQVISESRPTSLSLLQIPPTNGRIIKNTSATEDIISVFVSVEPIKLDVAALHSLATTIKRPGTSNVIAEIQDDINSIRAHLDEVFGVRHGELQSVQPQKNTIIYSSHLTLAGLDLFADTLGSKSNRPVVRLDFKLGCVQLLVTNRLEASKPVLQFPELRIGMRCIEFELSNWNSQSLEPCGSLNFMVLVTATSKLDDSGTDIRLYRIRSDCLEINLVADTAPSVMDVLGHLQSKIKDLDFSREKNYFRKLRKPKPRVEIGRKDSHEPTMHQTAPSNSIYSLELSNIQVSWLLDNGRMGGSAARENENLVLSLKRIDLSTRKQNSARLTIENLQLQMEPNQPERPQRSLNSALLPEIIFNVGYVSTMKTRRLAFQAVGKSLDLRLTSQFMIPASRIQDSISVAVANVRVASAAWPSSEAELPVRDERPQPFFGKKRMESLLIDADFAGAVVYLSASRTYDASSPSSMGAIAPKPGKYGQFTHNDTSSSTVLRAPGLAWKVEYKDSALDDPSLNAELKVHASSNILYPSVVPLIMEISGTVKEVVGENTKETASHPRPLLQKSRSVEESNILTTDPSALLGRTKLNIGLRICRQDFSLSCQPVARVAATAQFDNIYLAVNTVRSGEHGHFFAASATITKLRASVQHVYSRDPTGSFNVESMFLSLMNSKHVNGTSGVSAILKISPMEVMVNAKQLQDFLLFREIWIPLETQQRVPSPAPSMPHVQYQTFLVQRYHQVATTGAFPWSAAVAIEALDVHLDMGQSIGKSAFVISKFWASSKKYSDWEQNLCLGFDTVAIDSTGRMSGSVGLQDFRVRTSIRWPALDTAVNQTPLVQGSLAFSHLRAKVAFDYQAFLVADVTSFEFLMYNVQHGTNMKGDRLVATLTGQAVNIFGTTMTASQSLALYQAFQRLIQEKRANYESSLAEIEKLIVRKAGAHRTSPVKRSLEEIQEKNTAISPISLHTDVIVTMKAVNIGAFPNTFSDPQIFKMEALDAQARFAVTMHGPKIHSTLSLTLGQLRIGLASIRQADVAKSVVDLSVEDVVLNATGSRGGTILKVPRVEATMQTWQIPTSTHIDYIFRSSFEGKVEVGWNYSRISYIRSMWATHSKALAQRLGKPLRPLAVKITGVPIGDDATPQDGKQQKITAEVYVPQSKYDYTALEIPLIETPQLRDMGEATPPLEWIGLHRERLPNLTHQIIIIPLLEVASEVEDAYKRILVV